ncbi:MAG: phosphoglyceromutase [Candidatus Ancillula sp.]|jgi:2,3-bisphosphoglycerate-dependent phosphoglycerate mutase|nr:phosphoglyceromutase [Candidatus Ancillula sp.]
MVSKLILLRHGESEWNAKNLFTGWVDVNLSETGISEAQKGGLLLEQAQVFPDVVHTSLLRRAIMTANYALNEASRVWIPVKRSWRLNERHYGALQGKDKKAIREEYGEEQFMQWRRSYDVPPPKIEVDSEYSQSSDVRYKDAPEILSECLKDVLERVLPYWEDQIVPDLKAGKVVLVTAHGNSLRALVKYLENISDNDISGVNIPTGIPLYYELDDDFKILGKGKYLDPDAQAKIDAVANQGK